MSFSVRFTAASADELSSLVKSKVQYIGLAPELQTLDNALRFLPAGYLLQTMDVLAYVPNAAKFISSLSDSYQTYHVLLSTAPENFVKFYLAPALSVLGYNPISVYEPFSSYGPFSMLVREFYPNSTITLQDIDPICTTFKNHYKKGVKTITAKIPDSVPKTTFDWTIIGANSIRYLTFDAVKDFLLRLKTSVVSIFVSDLASEQFYPEYRGAKAHWKKVDNQYVLTHLDNTYYYEWYDYPTRDVLNLFVESGYALIKQHESLYTFSRKLS
jgi:hypothetical protein